MSPEEWQVVYKFFVIFLYAYFATLWSIPYVITKSRKYGYLTTDQYKKNKDTIPVMGGIAMLIGILVALSLSAVLLYLSEDLFDRVEMGSLFIFYFVVIVYGLYGILDDIFKFKTRYDKILATLVLTLPIAALIPDTTVHLLQWDIELGPLYALLFVPVFVMVVANLINLHAGYNGLTTGLELILIMAIAIKSYMISGMDSLLIIIPVFGALLAFLPKVWHPAKILPGNVGDFMMGAAIGGILVINNLTWFGIFILIPHILNFLMDTWTIVLRKIPDKKFGKVDKEGYIVAPPSMKYKSLKFLIVSWFKLTEKQAVMWMYAITAIFCILGIILF